MERATAAYDALVELAENVEDEWQYITDLSEAYRPSIEALGAGDEPLPAGAAEAVAEAIAEIGLIVDPHKAIDWLSTFPHVVAIALGGDVDAGEGGDGDGGRDGHGSDHDRDDEPPNDSPFKLLQFHR